MQKLHQVQFSSPVERIVEYSLSILEVVITFLVDPFIGGKVFGSIVNLLKKHKTQSNSNETLIYTLKHYTKCPAKSLYFYFIT